MLACSSSQPLNPPVQELPPIPSIKRLQSPDYRTGSQFWCNSSADHLPWAGTCSSGEKPGPAPGLHMLIGGGIFRISKQLYNVFSMLKATFLPLTLYLSGNSHRNIREYSSCNAISITTYYMYFVNIHFYSF